LILSLGILGATGAVGQRFILLLSEHPYLEISTIGASERSAGKSYAEAAHWRQLEPIPATVAILAVQYCRPELFKGCDIIFSGLDTAKAQEVELAFVPRILECFCISNGSLDAPSCPYGKFSPHESDSSSAAALEV
jgi:aspartate-semialdehyde dehydrogenase